MRTYSSADTQKAALFKTALFSKVALYINEISILKQLPVFSSHRLSKQNQSDYEQVSGTSPKVTQKKSQSHGHAVSSSFASLLVLQSQIFDLWSKDFTISEKGRGVFEVRMCKWPKEKERK